MLRKIIVLLSVLLCLVACDTRQNNIVEEDVFIEPMKDIFIFSELDDGLKNDVKRANGGKDFKNYQFKMLNKDVYENDLIDIYGNLINLKNYDEFILEVVSVECSHCKQMIAEHLMEMLEKGVKLVQYFDVGNKDEIIDLYNELDIEMSEDIVYLSRDDDFRVYIKDYLGLVSYPSLVCFKDNKVVFNEVGELSLGSLEKLYELSFLNTLCIDQSIIDKDRTIDDVKNDLSEQSISRIEYLDNDEFTSDLTYQIMGRKVDYATVSNSDSNLFVKQIDDFSKYENSDVVLIYSYLKDEDVSKIGFVNSLIDSNSEYDYILVLVEGLDTSSKVYNSMSTKFKCPVVSSSSAIPDDLYTRGMAAYPSAIFIKKGYFVGAYSNIESIDKFAYALETFMSDKCIGLTRNN